MRHRDSVASLAIGRFAVLNFAFDIPEHTLHGHGEIYTTNTRLTKEI
jgi:hypothetical protein